ncbi:hypothetical protein [Sphingomonas hengshuiensis]|uniref:Uncharacterized protein n=1 Tax=Sphingomonas hengshuiensis TaxID=1609977 RepID=A0A7U4J7A8_9SPHN|nr:hypothetical protein [Sphingomonas hengshuiensis]AJP71558.1 hypothetical protein TS85_06845 [Sphingomonas hengshuiensis]
MNAPLVFYPNASAVQTRRMLAVAGGAAALALLWMALRSGNDPLGWKLGCAVAATLCACLAGACHRAAQRVADARRNGEPQLVIDDFGISLRGDLRWRPTRIPWSRIRTISAVPDDKGVSIILQGKLRPYGSHVDVRLEDGVDVDGLEERLARFTPRLPTLH